MDIAPKNKQDTKPLTTRPFRTVLRVAGIFIHVRPNGRVSPLTVLDSARLAEPNQCQHGRRFSSPMKVSNGRPGRLAPLGHSAPCRVTQRRKSSWSSVTYFHRRAKSSSMLTLIRFCEPGAV